MRLTKTNQSKQRLLHITTLSIVSFLNQELVWHIVNNVNIPASKAPLFARSPFLEFQAIVPERAAEMMIASAPEDKRAAMEAAVRSSVDYAASVSEIFAEKNI